MSNLTMLMILDGFGINAPKKDYDFSSPDATYAGNAIRAAKTPNLDRLLAKYPHTRIGASGGDVGLPDGQMGNSEVGHLNLGAGRIVYQELTKITKHIKEGTFFENQALTNAMECAAQDGKALHLLGLLSDGGVHSHNTHLYALLAFAKRKGVKKVYIHALLDGRDVPPKCADKFIAALEDEIKKIGVGEIATIAGRYYGMDRDNRWERVSQAYDAMTIGKGAASHATSAMAAIEAAYCRGESDEFVLPTVIVNENNLPVGSVNDGDAFIMFNFRPDRAREITRCFVDNSFSGFARTLAYKDLYYVCMTQYDEKMPNVHVAFAPQSLKNTLGEYLSSLGKKQLRIAETEKYAHVTFFFNGGVEEPCPGEDRILIPSPKVATYDLQPEMSAPEVTDAVLEQIAADKYDLIILNFANPDMVGHTGSIPAAIKAVETVDTCVGKITEAILNKGGQLLITADHGNADEMIDADGGIMTAHSLNPTPLILVSDKGHTLTGEGVLADVAPTLLHLMGIPVPAEMTGKNLLG